MTAHGGNYEVELPAGGRLHLQNADEVDLWERSHERYVEDYHLSKLNDLVLLGGLLQQQILLFRAQREINGMEPEMDDQGVPTGKWVPMTDPDVGAATQQLTKATEQIRALEKSLGIDKISRESGGQHNLQHYLQTLKRAAHERGIRITERTLAYEKFCKGLQWRIRLLQNGDAEDRRYHNISEQSVLAWADGELKSLEQVDKDFANQKGKLYIGKL